MKGHSHKKEGKKESIPPPPSLFLPPSLPPPLIATGIKAPIPLTPDWSDKATDQVLSYPLPLFHKRIECISKHLLTIICKETQQAQVPSVLFAGLRNSTPKIVNLLFQNKIILLLF